MNEKITAKRIAKNLTYSVLAQGISLATSFVLGFIVPKFISPYQYAYWQTYVLYITYVGVLHFGLLDGLVLRYSQYDYEQLDKPRIRSQFRLLFTFLLICSCVTFIFAVRLFEEPNTSIIALIAVGIIIKNLLTYASYTFQITNRINRYATLIVIDRVIYAVLIIILLLLKVDNFIWYCIVDLASDLIGVLLTAVYSRDLYFGPMISLVEGCREVKRNLSAGAFLMLSNFSNNLLMGSARMVVQWHWSVLVFGQISFSFSLSNIFLVFITAISVVLFPSLKRMDQNELPLLYEKIRNVVTPLLNVGLLLFFPGSFILKIWLPQYQDSLVYLGVLLPIVVYLSKTSLLTNNYLKAYRKEKALFLINISTLVIAFITFLGSAYFLDNLNILIYSIVGMIVFKSIITEIVIMKVLKINLYKDFIIEGLMTIVFIISTQYCSFINGLFLYFFAILVYLFINWRNIVQIMKKRK